MYGFPSANLEALAAVNPLSESRISFEEVHETHQTAVLTAPPDVAIDAYDDALALMRENAKRMNNPELQALRNQHPFMPVSPFPMAAIFVVAQKANDTRDVQLPPDTQMVRFRAMRSIEFFVQVNGQVVFPVQENLDGNGPLYCPVDDWYYARGFRSLSIGLPVISTGVCIECYRQL